MSRNQSKTPLEGSATGNDRPIGVFDSGVGGLTVLSSIAKILPKENLMYLGDTARVPYGTKSAETVNAYALETAEFFAARGVKAMVIACNTASAMALPLLRERFSMPILGVVQPGATAAAKQTQNRRIGVIGTEATMASGAYPRALLAVNPEIEIFTRACPLFVPLAEEGWVDNDVSRRVVARYLSSLKASGVDTLVLGCTHYPLLGEAIGRYLGEAVTIVDSPAATAQALRKALREAGMLKTRGRGEASFFVTDVPDRFMRLGTRFYGESVSSAVRVVLRGAEGFAGNHGTG